MLEEVILESPPRTVEGVPETLPLLAEHYALAVVCDAAMTPGRVLRRVLELHGLGQWFAAFFFSDEHGWSKPDPRAFLTPLAALGVAPHEAVHVGDIQRTDIAGAQAAGLRAIHFVGVNSSDLLASSAKTVVSRFSELPAVIGRPRRTCRTALRESADRRRRVGLGGRRPARGRRRGRRRRRTPPAWRPTRPPGAVSGWVLGLLVVAPSVVFAIVAGVRGRPGHPSWQATVLQA